LCSAERCGLCMLMPAIKKKWRCASLKVYRGAHLYNVHFDGYLCSIICIPGAILLGLPLKLSWSGDKEPGSAFNVYNALSAPRCSNNY